jgi:hypothetical protein
VRANFLSAVSILVGLGTCFSFLQDVGAAELPYFALDLVSALDSQPKHPLKIGILEIGESEHRDTVPPPEVSGFDFYISSGLSWPWDKLSMQLVPQNPGQNVYSWTVVVVAPTSQEVAITWDASGAPGDVNPYFTEIDVVTGNPVEDLLDMKATSSLSVHGGFLAPTTKAFEFQFHLNSQPDPTSPVITLLGPNPLTLEVGTSYAEPGYAAADDQDGDMTSDVVVSGSVDHTTIGDYTLHYNVSDSSGNAAQEKTRTVSVVDTTSPTIDLLGDNPLILEVGVPYSDPGYTAVDAYDGDISSDVTITGSVDHTALGSYTLRYNVSDSSGNVAGERARVVNVVDSTAPVIALLGVNPVTLALGTPYVEPGYTATDNYEGDVAADVTVAGSVDHGSVGSYVLTYNVSDSSGNVALERTRTVNVVDTSAPIITLLGENPMVLEVGTPYSEPGCTALDSKDGDITASVVVTGTVDHTVLGRYTLRYNVSDTSGNPADEKTRIVNVVDTTPPAIVLLGDNPMNVAMGTSYVEPGYTATDNYDGGVTPTVTITGSVDHATVGSYTLRYKVSDSSGNVAEKTRTVNVVDTTSPTITVMVGVSPAGKGLKVKVDGIEYTEGHTFTWEKGSTHTLEASRSQTGSDSYVYTYAGWSDTGDPVHPVTPREDRAYTANYTGSFPTITVTVGVSPAGKGLKVKVDGTEYTESETFTWERGSAHTLEAPSPQTGSDSYVYTYAGWSDTGDPVHPVTPREDRSYTAQYASSFPTVWRVNLELGPTAAETTLTWSSLSDRTYSIFYSHDLFTWDLADDSVPSGIFGTTSWIDDGSKTGAPPSLASWRFYRILENP